MRHYEVMVILDGSLDERTVQPSLEQFLSVVRTDGGSVEKIEVWGKRRLAYEINKQAEAIYAVVEITAEPATVTELDRQLGLNESVLRTKVLRKDVTRTPAPAAG
ncbi:MAG: 30S ribosomal protein S6 [Actinomycetota bacterium]|nr:30S ribosomal protein S6 [Actinomycetota bacterium]